MDKRIKKKIFSSIVKCAVLLLFLSGWVMLGVALALRQANVNVGGSVTFTATGIYANIRGSISGTVTENNPLNITFNHKTKQEEGTKSWDNLVLDFDANNKIEIVIEIENLAESRDLYAVLTDDFPTDANLNITETEGSDGLKVGPEETKTIKIELSVANKNKSFTEQFNLGLDLSSDEIKEVNSTNYPNLTFEANAGGKTMKISKGATAPTENLVIPAKVKKNGNVYSVTEVAQDGFKNCSGIQKVTLPATLTKINTNAFSGCTSLSNIVFENKTGWIVNGNGVNVSDASQNATLLKTTYVNKVWTREATYVFNETKSTATLATINAGVTQFDIPSTIYKNEDSFSVTVVGYNEKTVSTTVEEITFPNSVKRIEYGAFYKNQVIQSIDAPGVEYVGVYAFSRCNQLETVELQSIKHVDGGGFEGCTKLKNVTLGDNLERLSWYAFCNCPIESIDLGNKLKVIGERAFQGARFISITIPATCEGIGVNAFLISSITSVTFAGLSGSEYTWKAGETDVTSDIKASTSTAANYLKTTYVAVSWTRS